MIGYAVWLMMALLTGLSQPGQELPTLTSLVEYPGCTYPCWPGLESELSSKEDVEQLFVERDIEYEQSKLGLSPGFFYLYTPVQDYPHPLVRKNAITVHVKSEDDRVHGTQIQLENVFILQVIMEFGRPDYLLEKNDTFILVYNEGISFMGPRGNNTVWQISLSDSEHIEWQFLNSVNTYQTMTTCTEVNQVCLLYHMMAANSQAPTWLPDEHE